MEYFSNTYGLVTDHDSVSENGQVFLTDYIMLLNLQGKYAEQATADRLMELQLHNSYAGIRGLYHRNPELSNKTMSHDNLSAIMAWSALNDTNHRLEIWSYLVRHLGTYDNTLGRSSQFSKYLPFNPANFFAWGLSAGSVLAYLFFPFFLINLIISSNKPKNDTSGKILSWIEMFPLKINPVVKLCFKYYEKKMIAQYGVDYLREIRKIYHGSNSAEFPINKLLGINNA